MDIDLLNYAIKKDPMIRRADKKNLVITCLDHMKSYCYVIGGYRKEFEDKYRFMRSILAHVDVNQIFYSEDNGSEMSTLILRK